VRRLIKEWFNRAGFDIHRLDRRPVAGTPDQVGDAYRENPEYAFKNLQLKLERSRHGGPFEYPEIALLNETVAALARGASAVAELGGGTGCFAYEFSRGPGVRVVSSEFDPDTSAWAAQHRARPNIRYTTRPISRADGPFDLVVSIEVIEHVPDFATFLSSCARLAPRAILTTPNKARPSERRHMVGPPSNPKHVREWTAGEFFWVLRCFYDEVRLLARNDQDQRGCRPVSVSTTMDRLIALCDCPRTH
jgi:SAM-dependent methyltransferase